MWNSIAFEGMREDNESPACGVVCDSPFYKKGGPVQ